MTDLISRTWWSIFCRFARDVLPALQAHEVMAVPSAEDLTPAREN